MSVKPIRALEAIREFLKLESASGIILVGAAVLALIANNSPLSGLYDLFLDTPVDSYRVFHKLLCLELQQLAA